MEYNHVEKPKEPLDELENASAERAELSQAAKPSKSGKDARDAVFWAPLKPEYLAPYVAPETKKEEAKMEVEEALESVKGETCETGEGPPPAKRAKLTKHAERKNKVQRPVGTDFATLCHSVAANEECKRVKSGGECKWSHDVEAFLRTQPEALPGPCPTFQRFGRCRYGIACRFRLDHTGTDEQGKLVTLTNEEKWKSTLESVRSRLPPTVDVDHFEDVKAHIDWLPMETNHITKDLSLKLRKKNYTFIKSVLAQHQITTRQNSPNRSYVILPKERTKTVDFKGKLILAPLTTIGNLPFRRICKRLGADITIGEMAVTHQLLSGQAQEWALVHRHESEDVFGVQIAGSHVDQCTQVVELLNKNMNVDFIDLNVGCPVDLMCQQGLGSALLSRLTRLEDIVTGMAQTSIVPITVKVRIGRDWDHPITHSQIAPVVHQWGASALTVHGRSKEQRYRAEANWEYVDKCAAACKVPLIGNGDIFNWEDAEAHLSSGNISSLMLARGAIIKPWLFTEIKEKRHWDISSSERFEILREFTNNGLEHWGSDSQGVEKTRYFLLNWLSMLNRYVPVGLLERVPIRIGQKAPKFIGRDDMETLMGSTDLSDMISISSMLLGAPPDNFNFEPKHKAGG
jgi:tRNA-dihydrouridine synthase 3